MIMKRVISYRHLGTAGPYASSCVTWKSGSIPTTTKPLCLRDLEVHAEYLYPSSVDSPNNTTTAILENHGSPRRLGTQKSDTMDVGVRDAFMELEILRTFSRH
jgi:hypothetical protein